MSETYAEWRQQFVAADPAFGPVPLWWWDAETVTTERIRWQMEQFRRGGLHNVCIINLAPRGPNAGSRGSDPPFYSEAWWDLFGFTVREGERLGIGIWYYDQIGFSGANFPARLATARPEYRGYRLTRWRPGVVPADAEILRRDVDWTYGVVRAGFNWLDEAASRALFDTIHGEMERRFGPYLGTTIRGSFQDELPPLPNWDARLLDRYRARYGDDLRELLPELFLPAEQASLARRRVFALLGELAEAAFFRPFGEWHRAHGMLWGCDQAGPGRAADPYGAQRLYLDYPRTHRWFLAPGNDPDGEIKFHASLAHLNGAPRVWFEAFHSSGWGGTIEDTMHWLIPWLQAGATLYNPHAVYFSTVGGWWEWAAPDTGWRQPYWEHYAVFADTVARVCRLLAAGRHVTDIAVYYPGRPIQESVPWLSADESAHPMEVARRVPRGRVQQITEAYWELVGRQDRRQPAPGALRDGRWDFDIVDDEALSRAAIGDDGTLAIGPERYKLLILPGTERLDDGAAAAVEQWLAQGGMAVAYRVPPEERRLAGTTPIEAADRLLTWLETALTRRVRGPGLSLIREADDGTRLYFLTPPLGDLVPMHDAVAADRRPPEHARYWLEGSGVVELWEPTTGATTPLAGQPMGSGVDVEVPFVDWPAALVVMRPPAAVPAPAPPAPPGALALRTPAALPEPSIVLPETGWTVRVDPTLDNRYGDFDRHASWTEARVDVRRFEVRTERPGEDGRRDGWHRPPQDGSRAAWPSRVWSEAAYWRLTRRDERDAGRTPGDKPADGADAPLWTEMRLGSPGAPAESDVLIASPVLGDLSFRDWAGRMGRVPRTYLNFGLLPEHGGATALSHVQVPKAGSYWVLCEGSAVKSLRIDGAPVVTEATTYAAHAVVTLRAGWLPVELSVKSLDSRNPVRVGVAVQATAPVALPAWIPHPDEADAVHSSVVLPDAYSRVMMYAAVVDGAAAFFLNGREIVQLGEFEPYRPEGQYAMDVTEFMHPGANRITIRFTRPRGGRALVDGFWQRRGEPPHPWDVAPWTSDGGAPARLDSASPEGFWLVDRPHLLPRVGWLHRTEAPADVLPWALDPALIGQPVWLRAPLPVGARRLHVHVRGSWEAWVDGEPVAHDGRTAEIPPGPAGRWLVLRVEPSTTDTEAAVLEAPVYVETAPAPGRLGNWQTALGLPTFSGAVDYELEVPGRGTHSILDLGYVRGTSAVWVDGHFQGARVWHPHRYDCSTAWGPGPHRLRIRVTNTLGAFYSDGKPTSLAPPHQWPGGLYGPVRLWEGS